MVEDRTLRLAGRFPDADGAVIASAIAGIAERSRPSARNPHDEPWDARFPDALVELASCVAPNTTVAKAHAETRTTAADGRA